MTGFLLHPQLKADTVHVCDLAVCRVLLMNNETYPWLILVPRRDNLREIFDLKGADYITAMAEVHMVAEKLAAHTKADKMNVAALGNMVPQLHIHIIARYQTDPAWPGPIWNKLEPTPYAESDLNERLQTLQTVFNSGK